LKEDQIELIECFSQHFEKIHNFPPLTSKIYAYLILDCKREGITFDEIVETFNASKSSVSNSLNFLTQLKHIEHFTKIDTRKRFYRISPGNILMRLHKIHDMLVLEKKLSEKLKCYKLKVLEDPAEISIRRSEIYIEHLNKTIEELDNTILKLESVTQQNT
jgi:DNA-binding transcriptional regulator GbsR (MarR family)